LAADTHVKPAQRNETQIILKSVNTLV
jgi:hypothetical protein